MTPAQERDRGVVVLSLDVDGDVDTAATLVVDRDAEGRASAALWVKHVDRAHVAMLVPMGEA